MCGDDVPDEFKRAEQREREIEALAAAGAPHRDAADRRMARLLAELLYANAQDNGPRRSPPKGAFVPGVRVGGYIDAKDKDGNWLKVGPEFRAAIKEPFEAEHERDRQHERMAVAAFWGLQECMKQHLEALERSAEKVREAEAARAAAETKNRKKRKGRFS